MKTCKKCQTEKPETAFSKKADTRDGFQNVCKTCWALYNAARYKANPSRSAKNHADWCRKNPEKLKDLNRKWRQKYPWVYAAASMRNYAKKLNAIPVWSEREKISVVYKKAAMLGLEVDHIVPLKSRVVCGLHVWANIQILSAAENKAKKNSCWPDMPC